MAAGRQGQGKTISDSGKRARERQGPTQVMRSFPEEILGFMSGVGIRDGLETHNHPGSGNVTWELDIQRPDFTKEFYISQLNIYPPFSLRAAAEIAPAKRGLEYSVVVKVYSGDHSFRPYELATRINSHLKTNTFFSASEYVCVSHDEKDKGLERCLLIGRMPIGDSTIELGQRDKPIALAKSAFLKLIGQFQAKYSFTTPKETGPTPDMVSTPEELLHSFVWDGIRDAFFSYKKGHQRVAAQEVTWEQHSRDDKRYVPIRHQNGLEFRASITAPYTSRGNDIFLVLRVDSSNMLELSPARAAPIMNAATDKICALQKCALTCGMEYGCNIEDHTRQRLYFLLSYPLGNITQIGSAPRGPQAVKVTDTTRALISEFCSIYRSTAS